MSIFEIRKKKTSDGKWIKSLLEKHWGSSKVVTRGKITHADHIPGYIASIDNKPVGLITYLIRNDNVEIISLNSEKEGIGIGSALIHAVVETAKKQKYKRVWVITTNDNLSAISFYKKRGFSLKVIHKNAIDESRKLKLEIPMFGINGIPIKDELEFEIVLN